MNDGKDDANDVDAVTHRVSNYLKRTETRYEIGSDMYYARRALEAALEAYKNGNYGIGAVAVIQQGDELHEFLGENAMIKGLGVVDHAETRALIKMAQTSEPDRVHKMQLGPLDTFGSAVFGTLEPCPMCASTLTNSGVTRSVSTKLDGVLKTTEDGYKVSDGAANVIGDKYPIQPDVWQAIQKDRGLRFELLDSPDEELTTLSWEIFVVSRAKIDEELGGREPLGKWAAIRSLYNARSY